MFFLLLPNNWSSHPPQVLPSVHTPVLILHAEDDDTISISLARKLFKDAKKHKHGKNLDIAMEEFPGELGFGHNHIHRAEQLPELLKRAWKLESQGLDSQRLELLKPLGKDMPSLPLGKKGILPPLKCEPRPGGWDRQGEQSIGSPQLDVLYSW